MINQSMNYQKPKNGYSGQMSSTIKASSNMREARTKPVSPERSMMLTYFEKKRRSNAQYSTITNNKKGDDKKAIQTALTNTASANAASISMTKEEKLMAR